MELYIQPQSAKLGEMLRQDLLCGEFDSFIFCAAYAKQSGVEPLRDAMKAFHDGGGKICATVGIDQLHTSREALEQLLGLSDLLYIYYNNYFSSTYHPKGYFFRGENLSRAYVGSSNLTEGGLYTNYEIWAREDFNMHDAAQREAFLQIEQQLTVFQNPQQDDCCRIVTPELIEELVEAGLIFSEAQAATSKNSLKRRGRGTPLFGTQVHPGWQERAVRSTPAPKDDAAQENAPHSFFKRLSPNDVNRHSSPGQIIIPIQFKGFFDPFINPQTTPVGAKQSERFFNLRYRCGGEEALVNNARVIFYEPAPSHKRKNKEIRFTLRNRDIFWSFEEDDILLFSKAEPGEDFEYEIKRIPKDSPEALKFGAKRYGTID